MRISSNLERKHTAKPFTEVFHEPRLEPNQPCRNRTARLRKSFSSDGRWTDRTFTSRDPRVTLRPPFYSWIYCSSSHLNLLRSPPHTCPWSSLMDTWHPEASPFFLFDSIFLFYSDL